MIIAISDEENNKNSELGKILFRTYDRLFLFNLFFEYFRQKPILGYGGNTLDQIILRPSFGQEIKKLTNVCYLIGRSKQDGKEQKNIHGFFQERSCA